MYEEARHEALTAAEWNENLARAAIEVIVQDAHERFDPNKLWPVHPLDRPGKNLPYSFKMLYFGAAGVIWALHYLKRVGATETERDYSTAVVLLAQDNRREMNLSEQETSSFLMGDAGILLVQLQVSPDDAVKDSLFNLIKANLRNPTKELMWGAPGTMLAALFFI